MQTNAYCFRFKLAYDGTAYGGWQIQPNAVTIQSMIEQALGQLAGTKIKLHGSGRTDRGVHAMGQVAHCTLPTDHQPDELLRSLNGLLPPDIRVMNAMRCSPRFHARRSATSKEYRYFIWNDAVMPPVLRHYRTHVRQPLDTTAMQAAATRLEGRHDFAAFTANPNRLVESTVRDLYRLQVRRRGAEIVIIARADGFLYKMVRSLAGFLIRVGTGAVPEQTTDAILQSRKRTAHVPTAPPQGLFLWRVYYRRGTG
ncbi:MAG: tRNA pseudouridine(38-40) synthase TruA [Kiritimatiellia bacterium]|jgi:tRNA pseudouridine38-40 synthase